jgi:(3R)-3-[(carboxylmethyl)amino]fatty acid synthase
MSAPGSVDVPPVEYETDAALLAGVLQVYKPLCRYLRSATVTTDGEVARCRCEFVIPESCYIDDTGHFNSVEFNICYNQMFYYLAAKSVKERLLPVFDGWTMDDFWTRQLSDIFIANYESSFRRPIDGREVFSGEIEIQGVRRFAVPGRRPLIWIETSCGFRDDNGGRSTGKIRIAITNPPAN